VSLPAPIRVIRRKGIGSTQDLARRLADEGAPAWTVIVADRQTRGRGRADRRWSSGRGGLYFSLVLRPRMRPSSLPKLSLQAGRLTARVLAGETGLRIRVKPPNDVLAEGPGGRFRKVCGILIEAAGGEKRLDWAVVGLGVNISNRIPQDLPDAASLALLGLRRVSKTALLEALLQAFHQAWERK